MPNWKVVSLAEKALTDTIQIEKYRNHKKRRRHRLVSAAVIVRLKEEKYYIFLSITPIRTSRNKGSIN